MGDYNFGPTWAWRLGCVFAAIGIICALIGVVMGVIYLVNHIQIV